MADVKRRKAAEAAFRHQEDRRRSDVCRRALVSPCQRQEPGRNFAGMVPGWQRNPATCVLGV